MDAVVSFISSWPVLIQKAFTDHALVVAFISVAAVGMFVILQQELRPKSLVTNIAFVAGGWLITVSVLVYIMKGAKKAWVMLEQAMPFAGKLASYLYGICERHPVLALAIVGAGTTAYFLRRPWPAPVRWGPVRALCALFAVALAIHIAGPIADMIGGQQPVTPGVQGSEGLPAITPELAAAQAISEGDFRYLSTRQCVDDVSGYAAEDSSPWTIGVKPLGISCYGSLGHEGSVQMNRHHAYAARYNRLMYEHNKSGHGAGEQLGYAAHGGSVDR